jgi:hypothetical protein
MDEIGAAACRPPQVAVQNLKAQVQIIMDSW